MFGFSALSVTTFAALADTGPSIISVSVDEVQELNDLAVGQRAFTYVVAESEVLTANTTATYIFVGDTNEPIVLSDTITSLAIFSNNHQESFILIEESIGRSWVIIDTGQSPNWSMVDNGQSDTWQLIDTTQNPLWTDITR